MIEQIEARIKTHIQSILDKQSLEYYDYQTLVGEINRQAAKDKEAKLEADNKAWREKMATTMADMVCGRAY